MERKALDAFTLEIPKIADWLNANQKPHWAKQNKLTRAWRHGAHIYARQQKAPKGLNRARVDVYVWKSSRRRYDPHNLMPTMKPIIDGLVDYGLLPDDSHEYLEGPFPHHGGYGPEKLVVAIQPLPPLLST